MNTKHNENGLTFLEPILVILVATVIGIIVTMIYPIDSESPDCQSFDRAKVLSEDNSRETKNVDLTGEIRLYSHPSK